MQTVPGRPVLRHCHPADWQWCPGEVRPPGNGVNVGACLLLLCMQCAGAVEHEVPVSLLAAVLRVVSTRQAVACWFVVAASCRSALCGEARPDPLCWVGSKPFLLRTRTITRSPTVLLKPA
jgi:hypothetical protein